MRERHVHTSNRDDALKHLDELVLALHVDDSFDLLYWLHGGRLGREQALNTGREEVLTSHQ